MFPGSLVLGIWNFPRDTRGMNRRKFIQLGVLGTGAALAGAESLRSEPAAPPASGKTPATVAMPISVGSRSRNRISIRSLMTCALRAGVNALFIFIYSHEAHRGGVAAANFHGGNYARPHMEFYKDTPLTLQDMRAPEFGDVDILERVIPVAKKHGIRVFPFLLEDNSLPDAVKANWETMYEVDHHGRRTNGHPGGPCFNNPGYQNFTLGLVEDYSRSYDIGGIMWGSERQGGLLNTLGLSQSNGQDPGRTTCFCEFCQKKGRDRGIDVERARRGFDALETFTRNCRAGRRVRADGYFTGVLAGAAEISGSARLGKSLGREPARIAGLDIQENQIGKSRASGRLACLAKCVVQSVPARRRKSGGPRGLLGFSSAPRLYNNVAGGRFETFVKGAQRNCFRRPATGNDLRRAEPPVELP